MGALIGGLVAGGLALLVPAHGESPSGEPWLQIAKGFLGLLALGGMSLGLLHWRQAVGPFWSCCRRQPSRRARGFKWAAWMGAVIGLAFWFHDIAYSHDHAVHCFKAFHFWNEMLGRGRLMGWSHFLAFGYPSGELTPFGPELWVALFRAVTLGLLTWPHTYALAFAGVVVFAAVALFRFSRRFFGRTAALIAVVIWVLDPGGWYQGGWFWLAWLGVWPVTLAMSFSLLAILDLSALLSEPPALPYRRVLLRAAGWMLASLVTHQLSMVVYAIVLPALLVAEWLRNVRLARAQVLRFAAAVGLGCGLAAFYLVPMLARNGLTQDLGVRGFAVAELAQRVVDMGLFENGWPPIVVLGLLGGMLALRSRAAPGLFFALCTSCFVLLSSDVLLSVLHVERWMEGILKIEAQRMLLVAKLFWFPLAAHAAVTFFRRPAVTPSPADSPWRRLGVVVLLAALAAPLAMPVARHFYRTRVSKTVEHRGKTSLVQDLRQLHAWSRRERHQSDEPYRIAYALAEAHEHVVSISPVFDGTLLYKVGYTPAQQFRSFPMSDEPELLEALGVKYLVADHDYLNPVFTHERSFGQLRLYRFARYQARRPFTLTGSGQAELVKLEPEHIHLRVRGAAPGARLKVHVAGHPRWQAKLNGREVPIAPATVYGGEYPFLMEIPAADGDVVFSYVRRAPEWFGLTLTLLSLLIVTVVASGRRLLGRVAWGQALLARAAQRAHALPWVAGALALVILVLGIVSLRPAAPAPAPVLDRLGANDELLLAGVPCQVTEPGQWDCGGRQLRRDVVGGAYGSHLCWTAPGNGPLAIAVQKPLGRFLAVSYDARRDVTGRIRIHVDGEQIADAPTRPAEHGLTFLQADTRGRAGQLASLRFELEGAPLQCFDLRIVR